MTSTSSSLNDWRLFQWLLPYARPYLGPLGWALLLLLPLAAAGALQPILIGQAISLLRKEPTWSALQGVAAGTGLQWLAGLLLVTVLIKLAFRGVQGYIVQDVGQRITADIRQDLFDHVTSLAVRFYDRTPVGKLVTRLTSDVEALGDVFSTGAIGIVSDVVSLLAVAVAMFWLQWKLALLLVLMLVPVTLLIVYFQQQYRRANYRSREELSLLNASLQENVLGIDVVQLFQRESLNSEAFRRGNERYIRAVDKTIFHDSAISATLEWISLGAIAGVLWLGGDQVLRGQMTLGTLASFILFAQRVFDPLRQLAEKFTAIQAGLTALERITELMTEPVEIRDVEPDNRQALTGDRPGEVRFEQVWFGYKADEPVIEDLNFTLRPGEKVAIVGPTGAGKSTIIRLLCRLYDPTQGRILVDGIDIRNLPQAELRQHIGVILQDGFLFVGDVFSNITLGEDYSPAQVQQAAQQTGVASFIEQLPQGYRTELRERGTNISAGQKQLLAFARVAIREPNILVLDEATANLDVQTEALIQQNLEHLLEQRTAIIIAHRLSTIRNVDRILVLKRGRLVETGTHEQLLSDNGLYASLYRLQQLGVAA
jgi:ATP-binding cassette, subfamily B, multidrug efflux pump